MGESPEENFFSVNHWILGCFGIMSPNNGGRISNLIFLIQSRVTMSVMLFYMIAECMAVAENYEDRYALTIGLTVAITHAVGIAKELFVLMNNQKLKHIMANLAGGEFRYEKCQERGFDPESIIRRYKQFGKLFSRTFLIFGILTVTLGCLPPLVDGLVLMRNGNGTDGNFILPKLSYRIWTPFEPTTWIEYSLVVVYQCFPFYFHLFGVLGTDTLCVNIMNCVAMNLTLIQKAYLTLRERCTKKVPDSGGLRDSPELTRVLKLEMKKISQHLQSIYKICDDLEDMSKYAFLFQTSDSMFCICFSLYSALNAPVGESKMTEFSLLGTMTTQLFLYCWFGNEVMLKAEEIPLCIWESDWISMDNPLKKDMILTMARANKPLFFTAGKFVPLTLETFVQILKGSYSFYAFMKSFQETV